MDILFSALAGLSLLMYGMNLMAAGLQKVAGNQLKSFIRTLTKNRFMAVVVGAVVTAIIQSSAATSIMVVGFVNAGIMTLQQAIGVIFGANIGTTISGQLIALNLTQFAPIALAAGIFLRMIAKKSQVKDIAEILLGFGILFFGMLTLKQGLAPLQYSPVVTQWVAEYGNNPLMGIALGFVMTIMFQSSAATVGILIALGSQGVIPFMTALYIIFGDNIGTCVTSVISALGTSRESKRVAVMHLSFNVIGTIYFSLLLTGITQQVVEYLTPGDIARQIANAHSLFNIVNVIVLFPVANWIVKLAYIILPKLPEEEHGHMTEERTYLDERMLKTPAIALKNSLYEFVLMAIEAERTMENAITAAKKHDKIFVEKAYENEKRVNQYEKSIIEFLVAISKENISDDDLQIVEKLLISVNDIERISDHAENIADSALALIERNVELGEEVQEELSTVYRKTQKGFQLAIDALSTGDKALVQKVIEIEREVDKLKIEIRDKHVRRMNKGLASPESGIFVMDLLSNLERISDHCRNIAEVVDSLDRNLIEEAVVA